MKTEFAFNGNHALNTFYSMGNPEITHEFLRLLIGNVRTLQTTVIDSMERNDYGLFNQAIQKGRGTISLVNNQALRNCLDSLQFCHLNRPETQMLMEKILNFEMVCREIIDSLSSEMEGTPTS